MAVFSRHGFTEASGEDTSEKSAPRPRSSPHPGSPSTCASAGPYRPHYSYPSATRLESYVIWAASVGKAPKSKETCIVGAISRGGLPGFPVSFWTKGQISCPASRLYLLRSFFINSSERGVWARPPRVSAFWAGWGRVVCNVGFRRAFLRQRAGHDSAILEQIGPYTARSKRSAS